MVALLNPSPPIYRPFVLPFIPKVLLMQAIPLDAVMKTMLGYGFRVGRTVELDRIALTFRLREEPDFLMTFKAYYEITNEVIQLCLGMEWFDTRAVNPYGFSTGIPTTDDPTLIVDALRAYFSLTPFAGACPNFGLPVVTVRNADSSDDAISNAPCAVWAYTRFTEAVAYARWWANTSFLNLRIRAYDGYAVTVHPALFG